MKFLTLIIAVSLSVLSSLSFAKGTAGEFDYYLMSLSWSPDYCATHQTDKNQCSPGKQLGFVLHGVWPQYDKGYPSSCTKAPADTSQCSVYPSVSLCQHEWQKHGTCSGLSFDQYVSFSKQLKDSVAIPAAYNQPTQPFRATTDNLKADFMQANPSLTANSIALACSGSGRFLQEVRVCFAKDGKATDCADDVLKASKKSCGQADFLVRSIK